MITCLLLTGYSGDSFGQYADSDAVEIIENLQQQYEESIENIDDYVMVTDDQTIYYKKDYEDGRPYFKSRVESDQMDDLYSSADVSDFGLLTPSIFNMLKENARYEGRDEIDGHDVHVLFIDELEGVFEDEDVSGDLENVRMYIDADEWVTRQINFAAHADLGEGRTQRVEPVTMFKNYRDIEGMKVPFQTVTVVTGLSDMLSDEQRREAEQAMERFEQELENMPAQQREMVEQMMGEQMDRYREMIEADRIEMVQQVQEVRVNTGMEDF